MSVVNKMLKDLEQREESSPAPANYQPPAKKSSAPLRIGALVVVGAILIGAVYFWPAAQQMPQTPSIAPINQAENGSAGEVASAGQPETNTLSAAIEPDEVSSIPARPVSGGGLRAASQPVEAEPIPEVEEAVQNIIEPDRAVSASLQSVAEETAETTPPQRASEPVIKPSSGDQGEALKIQIGQAISRNDTATAIRLLNVLIRQQPDNVAARKRLAALYFSAGRTTDAQQLLQKSVADLPADSSVRLMYARLMVQQNETKLAYYTLQDIDAYAQPSIELLGYRASLAQKLSLMDEALKDYARLVAIDSQSAKWWLGQAVVADKQSYAELAVSSYRQALALNQLEDSIEKFIRQRLTTLTGVSS